MLQIYCFISLHTHIIKETEYLYSDSLAGYRELTIIAAKILGTGRVTKSLFTSLLNDTTTVSILELACTCHYSARTWMLLERIYFLNKRRIKYS
jgi:hypothetical protein